MEKLFSIKGYWNEIDEFEFYDDSMWEGEMVVQEDGWFEGIVTIPNKKDQIENFIFGVLDMDKGIQLFKAIPSVIIPPFVYHCKGADGIFDGDVKSGNMNFGTSKLYVSENDSSDEQLKRNIGFLERRIIDFINDELSGISRNLYLKYMQNSEKLHQMINPLVGVPNDNFNEEVSLLKRKKYKA